MWNPSDIVSGHLLTVIILASVGGALLIALIIIACIKLTRKKARSKPKYSIVQLGLFKTKFTYTIMEKESNKYFYFMKVNYQCFDHYLTYYLYVPKCSNYLKLAKLEVNKLIENNKLCNYTLKVVPLQEFKTYAAR